jgi:TonB family protein
MRPFLGLLLLPVSLLLCAPYAMPQKGSRTFPRPNPKPPSRLVPIKTPNVPYPDEALKKHIEGTVVLSITVNEQGKVSDAKVISGPLELIQAALDSTKLWEFVPPNPAPFTDTASVSYAFPKPCTGPEGDRGEIDMRGRLRSEKGNVTGVDDQLDSNLPAYPQQVWQAGGAGRMVLALTVDSGGNVTQVSVVKSASLDLDRTAAETARYWRFKLLSGDPRSFPDVFLLPLEFRAACPYRGDR